VCPEGVMWSVFAVWRCLRVGIKRLTNLLFLDSSLISHMYSTYIVVPCVLDCPRCPVYSGLDHRVHRVMALSAF
jgi:hypothetical protein